MTSAAYSGPINHIVVVMLGRRSYDDVLGSLDGTDAAAGPLGDIPVTTHLARQFMVCDRWFASSPLRGAANALFAHCASAGGPGEALEPNVLSALDGVRGDRASVPNWKIYFHGDSLVARALPYAARCWAEPRNENLANYDEVDYPPGTPNVLTNPTTTFLQDVAQNRLPPYAFVEPRRGALRGPVSVATGDRAPFAGDPFDDEALVSEVYVALRTSAYWTRALLLVVSGDADAANDRVAPPAGWGGRVPAIVVSPYVERGSRMTASAPFEHASIVKTLWECFDLRRHARHVNARDAAAPSMLDHLSDHIVNRPEPWFEPDRYAVVV